MAWTKPQVRSFAKLFKSIYHGAWHYFVPSIQDALIAQRVLTIVEGQHAETISRPAIEELHVMFYAELRDLGMLPTDEDVMNHLRDKESK